MAKSSRGGRRGGGQLPRPTRVNYPVDQNGSDGMTPAKRLPILQPDIDRFKKNYGIDLVGFEKMNINVARTIIDKAEDIISDNGLTGKELPKIAVTSKMSPGYYAQFGSDRNTHKAIGVELNTRMFSDKSIARGRALYANDLQQKYHVAGTILEDNIYHEIGHAIAHAHNQNPNRSIRSNALLVGQAIANVNKITFTPGIKKGLMPIGVVGVIASSEAKEIRAFTQVSTIARNSISGYSLDSYGETIAEAYADVYANGRKANRYSKEIVRLIKGDM